MEYRKSVTAISPVKKSHITITTSGLQSIEWITASAAAVTFEDVMANLKVDGDEGGGGDSKSKLEQKTEWMM